MAKVAAEKAMMGRRELALWHDKLERRKAKEVRRETLVRERSACTRRTKGSLDTPEARARRATMLAHAYSGAI